ncbi:MAG: crossover junction endodeoxyribonuclease RuvC [Candidatus Absconditabacterales bacterium]|nr:crossover junction endodeoxyribonuclease RuvC [Candidatus Absconditabacterales bacterium]
MRKCGFAVLGAKQEILEAGVILQEDNTDDIARLDNIDRFIHDLFGRFPPRICAVEQLFFTEKNKQKAGLIYGVRYLILLRARQAGAQLIEVSPISLKKTITGNGNATKSLMTQVIMRLFGLAHKPQYADAVDALGLALMAWTKRGNTIER